MQLIELLSETKKNLLFSGQLTRLADFYLADFCNPFGKNELFYGALANFFKEMPEVHST